VECWLRTIAAWPIQSSLIESAHQMSELLGQIPADERILIIC
jgi:hypothetical protein